MCICWAEPSVHRAFASIYLGIGHYVRVQATRWWVFGRPLLQDPLLVVAIALGTIGLFVSASNTDGKGSLAIALGFITAIPFSVLFVGIVGGSIREYRAGRSGSA